VSLLLSTLAAALLGSAAQARDAVEIPWRLDLPAFEGATEDAGCGNSRPSEHAYCVFLPLPKLAAYYRALEAADWRRVAATDEMLIYQKRRDDGQCEVFSVWLAGRGDEGMLVLRQFEPMTCVHRS
jgi:hypothetical protein